jgi:putative NADH-flavin reductase
VGDAADASAVAEAADGQDAVISVVAAPDRRPTTAVSDIAKALVAGMDKTGARRLVMTSSRNITATKPWIAVAPTKWMFRHVYADLGRAEDIVRASDLDWTIVRAVMLTDDPPRGRIHIDREANATGGDWRLPRGDYARVLLDTALNTTTTHQAIGVNGVR